MFYCIKLLFSCSHFHDKFYFLCVDRMRELTASRSWCRPSWNFKLISSNDGEVILDQTALVKSRVELVSIDTTYLHRKMKARRPRERTRILTATVWNSTISDSTRYKNSLSTNIQELRDIYWSLRSLKLSKWKTMTGTAFKSGGPKWTTARTSSVSRKREIGGLYWHQQFSFNRCRRSTFFAREERSHA